MCSKITSTNLPHALLMSILFLFVLDLHMKYTMELVLLCMYMCGVLSCDSSTISKKCCPVLAHRYTLDDDSECPMDYALFLLPKVCP